MTPRVSAGFAPLRMLLWATIAAIPLGAHTPAPDRFARVSVLVGRWQGTVGKPFKLYSRSRFTRVK